MGSSIKLFRIFGIDIGIHWSWIFIFVIVTWTFATGIEMRVFKRDENKDIIGEFLKDGEHESIPVAVFYTKDHRYIAHFIERPQLAYDEMRTVLAPMYARMRKPDATPEEREAMKQEYIAFQNGPIWSNWRRETVRECIRLLEAKVS